MTKLPGKWVVEPRDSQNLPISPVDLNCGMLKFDTANEAKQEAHRLLQRFSEQDGPEPYVADCLVYCAVSIAERQMVQAVGTVFSGVEPDESDDGGDYDAVVDKPSAGGN